MVQSREQYVVWERIGNSKYTDALSSTLAFEKDSLKEMAVYWELGSLNEADVMYNLILGQVEDDYGKFVQGVTKETNGIVKSHSKTVSTPYVVNVILRDIGGRFLVKLSATKSKNPEKYVTGVRVAEAEGGFSYICPEGWLLQKSDYSKFSIAYGPRENDFSPNINFAQEVDSRSLQQYVDANLEHVRNQGGGSPIEGPIGFSTNDGLKGIRVTFMLSSGQSVVRLRQYYFQNGARKLIVTCGTLNDSYDAIFDEAIKTFSFN